MVSRASTHAEFYAIADCVEEVFPIKGISSELVDIKDSTIKIYEGIKGAIILSKLDKTLKISNIFNSLFAVWYIHALIKSIQNSNHSQNNQSTTENKNN